MSTLVTGRAFFVCLPVTFFLVSTLRLHLLFRGDRMQEKLRNQSPNADKCGNNPMFYIPKSFIFFQLWNMKNVASAGEDDL